MESSPISQLPKKSKRKIWITLGILGVLVAAIIVVVALTMSGPKEQLNDTQNKPVGSKEFKAGTESVVKYAGNSVYDACNLLSFATVKKNVNNFQEILDMVGTDKKPSEPLTIEHNYIDRDIAAPLGKDGQPRPTGTTIGGQSGVSASSFVSDNDSNCWYGQGNDLSLGIGKTFAKLYVTQKPTPLSSDLTEYLGTLTKAVGEGDLDVYVEQKTDSGGFYTSIITNSKSGTVAILKTSTSELGKTATLDIAGKLSEKPTGAMTMTYPLEWSSMPDVCALLGAGDFQRFTGKPASALANDVVTLSEIGGRMMQRSCERLEVERLDGSSISKSNVTVRLANNPDGAKMYIEDLKKENNVTIEPLKQKINLADEAYVRTTGKDGYEIGLRIGAAVISMDVRSEQKDASADAYVGRMLAAARTVAENYRQ